jgi:WS/DGAT/MGAT family acyltransferase
LHHCIADGIALVRVLLDLTDDGPANGSGEENSDTPGESESNQIRSDDGDMSTVSTPAQITESFVKQGVEFLSDPEKVRESAKLGVESSKALAHLLLLTPDPETSFKGELGVRKRCSWSKPIPLARIKEVGQIAGGTVNDVLLSTVAGAFGRYLRRKGEAIGGLDFRAVVPVNLRPLDEELTLGNSFGIVFLSLPIGIDDPIERLHELKRRMDAIKGTPEAIVSFGILTAIGIASPEIEDIVVNIFGKKGTAVMTNVPGPREVRYLAGKPIRGIMAWVPQSGRLGLGVSIISYAGDVLVGIATDAGLTPDPENIVQAVHDEFNVYSELVDRLQDDS